MASLSAAGRQVVEEASERHRFGTDAVSHMLQALNQGGGRQAQFNHPEFGGMGQWSAGGMTMIGDMFNTSLKARVDGLCADLCQHVQEPGIFTAGSSQSQWQGSSHSAGGTSLFVAERSEWPADLGRPAAQGAQNDMRYAYFAERRRLAVSVGGKLHVYDTGDLEIGGFGQSQGGSQSVTFTSQRGIIHLADLRMVDTEPASVATSGAAAEIRPPDLIPGRPGADAAPPVDVSPVDVPPVAAPPRPEPAAGTAMPGGPTAGPTSSPTASDDEQIFLRLEKLADFHARGILSDEEFAAKKSELLARL